MNITGVEKAFSFRNLIARACRSRDTGVNRAPAWPMCFCCES